jgi:hypothetical protein
MEAQQEVIGFIGKGVTRRKEPDDYEIAIMGKEGDTKQIWNPQNTDEVENARRTFNDLRKKGYLAFRVTADGDKGEQISEFDPKAGKMILMVPQMQGG